MNSESVNTSAGFVAGHSFLSQEKDPLVKRKVKSHFKMIFCGILSLALSQFSVTYATGMDERVSNATSIFEKKQSSSEGISPYLLSHAQGVAIFTLTKAGIGIGGVGGEGIVIVHDLNGPVPLWRAPFAFDISGASLGAQLGFSQTRYIMLLNTADVVNQFTHPGKVEWNAVAAGTAGSDSEIEKESTSDLSKREVIIYRDSGGLFGGATLGGSTIEVQNDVNERAYGDNISVQDILKGRVAPPASAIELYRLLNGR